MCFTAVASGIIIIYSYSLLHRVCYNGFTVRLPPFWDPVIFAFDVPFIGTPLIGEFITSV